MKRTTVMLPDDLYALLDRERRRRDVAAAAIIREALEQYLLARDAPRKLDFIGTGRSGGGRIAERIEEIMAEDARSEEGYNRMMFGTPSRPDYAKPDNERLSGPTLEPPADDTGAEAGSA